MHEIAPAFREAGDCAAVRAVECEVLLDNIEIMADIGAYAAECGVPQPLRIHVVLRIVPPMEDELSRTFDYSAIHGYALDLAARRICLIETFAWKLARMCLESDLVREARVRIEKPRAIPGCLAGTRVTLRKT